MASISQSYCYYREDKQEFCQVSAAYSNNLQVPHQIFHGEPSPSVTMMISDGRGEMWAHDQDTFNDSQQMQSRVPIKSDSSFRVSVYPERLGVSDNPAVQPDFYSSFCSFGSGTGTRLGTESCLGCSNLGDFWGDCYNSDDRFKPLRRTQIRDMNSGIHQGKQVPLTDTSSSKVGRYTVEERKDRILRYLKKRSKRNFNKTIKYACRKTLADRRVRVRGRFARNDDCHDEEIATKKNYEVSQEQNELLIFGNDVQIKQDSEDDQWLQEAMAGLICMPHISGCC